MKTSRTFQRAFLTLLLTASLVCNSGCFLLFVGAVGGAAAAGVAYTDGVLTANLGHNYDSVVAATNKAIDQLQFARAVEQKDALSDTLTTHTGKGEQVKITLTKINDTTTKIDIRIGTFGDQAISLSILDKIKANLG